MHTSNLHLLLTTVCVSAQTGCPVGQRQLSAPWTGLALQDATTALYLTSKWLASWPQRLPTCMQNYCGTRGNYCTVHCQCLCSESGLLCYYYCNCHCCRLVCSGEAETLWLVCWMGFVQNVVGNVLVLGGFFGGGSFTVSHLHLKKNKKIKKWRGKNRSVVKIKEVRNGMHDKYMWDEFLFPRYVPKSSYAMIPLMTLASWKPYDGLYFDDAAKWSDWEQKVSPTGCCSKRKAE